MALIESEKGFDALTGAESAAHVDPSKRYMLVDGEGVPYSVPGSKVALRISQGAKLGTTEEIAQHRERFASSVQEGEHPYVSTLAAAAAPFVAQAVPLVGGYLEEGIVSGLEGLAGLNEGEGMEFVERAERAHPWVRTAGQVGGFAAGIAALAPIHVAGLAVKAEHAVSGAKLLEGFSAGARALAGSAAREAVLAGVQGFGAGWNESVLHDPDNDVERALSSAVKGGGLGALFGAGGAVGAAGLVKGAKSATRAASVAYNKGIQSFVERSAAATGEAPPSAKESAFLHVIGAAYGKGRIAGTLAEMDPAAYAEAQNMVMANVAKLKGLTEAQMAGAIPKMAREATAATRKDLVEEGAAAVRAATTEGATAEAKQAAGAIDEVLQSARERAVLAAMGVRGISPNWTIDRLVSKVAGGAARVRRIATRLEAEDVVKQGFTVKQAWDRSIAAQLDAGKQIDTALTTLHDAGVAVPNISRLAKRIAQEVGPRLEQETVLGLQKSEMQRLRDIVVDPLMKHAKKAESSWEYIIKTRRELGKELFKPANEKLRGAYTIFNEEIERTMAQSPEGAAVLDEWKAANARWSDYQEIRDHVIAPSYLGYGPKKIDLTKGLSGKIDLTPRSTDYLNAIPEGSALAAKYAARLRATASVEELHAIAGKAFGRRQIQRGLRWDSDLGKSIKAVGSRSLMAGGGLAGVKVLAPESEADMERWAREHPAAAVGLSIAALAAMSGAGKFQIAKGYARFVGLGQTEIMKGFVLASHASEEATTVTARELFAEMATVKGATGVGIHHTAEETAAEHLHEAAHGGGHAPEAARPLGKGLIRQAWEDAATPENAVAGIAEALAPLTAILPQTGAITQASLSRDRAYLAQQAPKAGPSGYFDPPHEPSAYQQLRIEQTYSAMYDTQAALKAFNAPGELVPQHVLDAIRETRPAVYQDYARAVLAGITTLKDRGRKPPYQERLRLGKITGMPLDLSEEPASRMAYAQFWASYGQLADEQPGAAPRGRRKPKGAERRSGSEIASTGE